MCSLEPRRASAVIISHSSSQTIFGRTPKRGSTCQRSVRSTKSYAFCRPMKHRNNSGTRAFLPSSCITCRRTVRAEPALLLWQDFLRFAVGAESRSDGLEKDQGYPRVLRVRYHDSLITRPCPSFCAELLSRHPATTVVP